VEPDCAQTRLTEIVKSKAEEWGAALVGVAHVSDLKSLETIPAGFLEPWRTAVALGVEIPWQSFEAMETQPTREYSSACAIANQTLQELGGRVVSLLCECGFTSTFVGPTGVEDWTTWSARLSHKAVAYMAGRGWIGKSGLLVTRDMGPRVRLATVLTSCALQKDQPMTNACGGCVLCVDACPGRAIIGASLKTYAEDRADVLLVNRCVDTMSTRFGSLEGVDPYRCGLCIKVCPFGRKASRGKMRPIPYDEH
jgi:epoxyqueuosine reductase